ncbi:MAG TPA: isoprenylcysteine carboxylmethyltransferase family protein [Herpetosiphonaceae bacterium]
MSNEAVLRAILAAQIVVMLLIRSYYRAAARSAEPVSYKESTRQMIAQAVLGLGGMITVLVYLLRPSWMEWSALPLPIWVRWLGAALGAVALPLLVWVQHALGQNFSTVLHVRQGHTLITSGPYRTVRHPMYSVLFLLALGLTLLSADWAIGLFWLGGVAAVVAARLRHEEAVMLETFGERYRAYMQRSNRFLPKLVR